MNPIYKFMLSAGNESQQAFPIYNNDFAIEYEKQTNQEFYRAKLSGKLTFVQADFDFVDSQVFDTAFGVGISVSYDAGTTWNQIWTGEFYKTDCTFDEDNKTLTVTPTPKDVYDAILAGLDKEYNLIELAPEIAEVRADKRPLIQVYTPGDTVVGCFLSGMWWEEECEPVTNTAQLINTYHFSANTSRRVVEVTRPSGEPFYPDAFAGAIFPANTSESIYTNNSYRFVYSDVHTGGVSIVTMELQDDSEMTLWWYQNTVQGDAPSVPGTYTFTPFPGSTATQDVTVVIRDVSVFARMLTDREVSTQGVHSSVLPDDDIVGDNRNYSRVVGYNIQGVIRFQDELTDSPTQWGLYKPGQYYRPPLTILERQMYPVARSAWGAISIWFAFSSLDFVIEPSWRSEFTLRDCYPIWSVISVLLKQIAPGINHNIGCSRFLYPWTQIDSNPIDSQYDVALMLTPKSNVINSGYDQPAQQAKITLATVLNMLRDVYRCYWYISGNQLRIEHVEFFRNGGSYDTAPSVGIDLTKQIVTRNGLPWSFDTKKYQFDKPDMAGRYQFRWMDDVTQMFEGLPIDIISNYVNKENIEEISINNITSDFDYVLLNPDAVSQDGFVLLAAKLQSGTLPNYYKLKYYDVTIDGQRYVLQNGYASMYYAETELYGYNMPAKRYEIGGREYTAVGVNRLKTQTVTFPMPAQPDLAKLVKTSLGNGTIQKMSISLSARSAKTTLCYDTE